MEEIRSLPRSRRVARMLACVLLALLLTTSAAPAALAAGGGAKGAYPSSGSASGAAGGSSSASPGNGNAFNELSNGGQAEESTQTQKKETNGSTGQTSNSKKTIFIGIGAAVVLLVAIASVIVRDARRVAPAGDGPLGEAGSARDTAAALRKRRAKAKAAKRQRKRNR